MNLEPIRNLSERRDGGLKKLAADIGMSEANLHRCLRLNRMMANDLEKLCSLLQIPLSVIMTDVGKESVAPAPPPADQYPKESHGESQGKVLPDGDALTEKIKNLEREVADLRSIIKDKDYIISLLRKE